MSLVSPFRSLAVHRLCQVFNALFISELQGLEIEESIDVST